MTRALVTLGALLALTAPAQAQQGAGVGALTAEQQTLLFVPPLDGALTLGAGLQSRALSEELVYGPEGMAELMLGGRLYLDEVGAVALGAHVRGALTLPQAQASPLAARRPDYWGVDAGLHLQLRGMSEDFIFGLVGVLVEVGALGHDGDALPQDPLAPAPGPGLRAYAGLEGGFGFLGWLDPYIYAESGVRLGVERVQLGGATLWSLHFAWEARLDFALR